MRVTIPEQSVNLQVMVNPFNLLGRLARRNWLAYIAVIHIELDDFLRRKILIVDV